MGPDVQWRQRVTAHWNGHARSFDAVLSKVEDELLLVGLSPMGTPGFTLTLRDGKIEFVNRSPESLPFEPRYILIDVQRTFFPWIPGVAPQQGERRHDDGDESIVEVWSGGHLEERRFRRKDGAPAGEIVIRYEGWQADRQAPAKATLDNGWFGYSLEIETFVEDRL